MSDNNTLEVKILDKDYLVACPPQEQPKLRAAADQLDKKMREIRASGKVHGTERIAVMAALNITYDLQQSDASQAGDNEVLNELEAKLDAALAGK